MRPEIKTEKDAELYFEYFKNINIDEQDVELSYWLDRIDNVYNNFELLAFLKVLDYLEIDDNRESFQTIDVLSEGRKELESCLDSILDKYNPKSIKQKELLDKINESLSEYDALYKFYNEKIIND